MNNENDYQAPHLTKDEVEIFKNKIKALSESITKNFNELHEVMDATQDYEYDKEGHMSELMRYFHASLQELDENGWSTSSLLC